jgi:P27 family predicted phage terminase small subunit
MRGKDPKSPGLRLIEGNRSRTVIPKSVQPKPSVPRCPGFLDKIAKAKWREIVREYASLGILSQLDGTALSTFCNLYSKWRRATEKAEAEGFVVEGSTVGSQVKSPWLRIAADAENQMRLLGAEFGLSPLSRQRIHAPSEARESLDVIAKRRADERRAEWERERKKDHPA